MARFWVVAFALVCIASVASSATPSLFLRGSLPLSRSSTVLPGRICSPLRGGEASKWQQLRAIIKTHCFDKYDKDGNGELSMGELQPVSSKLMQYFAAHLYPKMATEEQAFEAMASAFDKDGDNKITFDEMLSLLIAQMGKSSEAEVEAFVNENFTDENLAEEEAVLSEFFQ